MSEPQPGRNHVLWLSTIAFTLMFAVWLMFGILGKPIQEEFGLTEVQLSWVVGGGVGIVLPLNGALGLGLAALGLVVMLVLTIRAVRALPPTRSTRSARTTGPTPT